MASHGVVYGGLATISAVYDIVVAPFTGVVLGVVVGSLALNASDRVMRGGLVAFLAIIEGHCTNLA